MGAGRGWRRFNGSTQTFLSGGESARDEWGGARAMLLVGREVRLYHPVGTAAGFWGHSSSPEALSWSRSRRWTPVAPPGSAGLRDYSFQVFPARLRTRGLRCEGVGWGGEREGRLPSVCVCVCTPLGPLAWFPAIPDLLGAMLLYASLCVMRLWLCCVPRPPSSSLLPHSCPVLAASGNFLAPSSTNASTAPAVEDGMGRCGPGWGP